MTDAEQPVGPEPSPVLFFCGFLEDFAVPSDVVELDSQLVLEKRDVQILHAGMTRPHVLLDEFEQAFTRAVDSFQILGEVGTFLFFQILLEHLAVADDVPNRVSQVVSEFGQAPSWRRQPSGCGSPPIRP